MCETCLSLIGSDVRTKRATSYLESWTQTSSPQAMPINKVFLLCHQTFYFEKLFFCYPLLFRKINHPVRHQSVQCLFSFLGGPHFSLLFISSFTSIIYGFPHFRMHLSQTNELPLVYYRTPYIHHTHTVRDQRKFVSASSIVFVW